MLEITSNQSEPTHIESTTEHTKSSWSPARFNYSMFRNNVIEDRYKMGDIISSNEKGCII